MSVTATKPAHPAKYTPALIPHMARYIEDGSSVLDPFAGIGGIYALLQYRPALRITAIEIEPLWAAADPRILCGESVSIMASMPEAGFDYIVTSPCYGNRMADHHNAGDSSTRATYRHVLGQPLAEGSAAGLQWGPAYRTFHIEAWRQAYRVATPYGVFILNIKDHYRAGRPQGVDDWHIKAAEAAGWNLRHSIGIPAPGNRYGANGALRAPIERLLFFRKMP